MKTSITYCISISISCFSTMNMLERIVAGVVITTGLAAGAAKAQEITGTVLNYNENPAVPVAGIEVYADGALVDTTNVQGAIGFPTAIERYDLPKVPKDFTMKVFLNPFNPQTILEYTIPSRGDVTITGYNILGQTIFSENYDNQQMGKYKLTFDADKYDLSSGHLFFRIEIDPADKSKGPMALTRKGVYINTDFSDPTNPIPAFTHSLIETDFPNLQINASGGVLLALFALPDDRQRDDERTGGLGREQVPAHH